jgi:hypothetical protein
MRHINRYECFMTAKQNTGLLRLLAIGEELFGGPIIAKLRISNNKKHIHIESTLENARQCIGYMANHDLTIVLQTLHMFCQCNKLKIVYVNSLSTRMNVHCHILRLEGKVIYYGEAS